MTNDRELALHEDNPQPPVRRVPHRQIVLEPTPTLDLDALTEDEAAALTADHLRRSIDRHDRDARLQQDLQKQKNNLKTNIDFVDAASARNVDVHIYNESNDTLGTTKITIGNTAGRNWAMTVIMVALALLAILMVVLFRN